MKKYTTGIVALALALVGVAWAGSPHRAEAYTWCFATSASSGTTWYAQGQRVDFGANGGIRACDDGEWVSTGSSSSTSTSTAGSLTWSPVAGAVSYGVQISANSDFIGMVFNGVVTGTSLSLSSNVALANLAVNVPYYWHVYAINAAGMKSAYSPTMSFISRGSGSLYTSMPVSVGTVVSSFVAADLNMSTRWVDADGDLVSPREIEVTFRNENGMEIFPESSWKRFGPDDD